MPSVPISDPADPRIGVFLGLRDQPARQRRERRGGDMAAWFIAEGDMVIERALVAGQTIESVLVAASRRKAMSSSIPAATPVYRASDDVLEEVTGRPELRDPIACFTRPPLPDCVGLIRRHATFAVLEGVNNPNNLGVIMRNAAGLGAGAVLLDPSCGDPLYRRAIRASMGQVFALPHTTIPALPGALDLLHEADVSTVALTPTADDLLDEVADELRGKKVAVLLGAEGAGLEPDTIAAAGHRARIPMAGGVDSLNVASAAAIAFYSLLAGRSLGSLIV